MRPKLSLWQELTTITWKRNEMTVNLSREGKAILSVVKGRQKRALKHAILRRAQ
jgi:hypothetical protein